MRVYLLREHAYVPADSEELLGVYPTLEAAMDVPEEAADQEWIAAGNSWYLGSEPSHRIEEHEVQE